MNKHIPRDRTPNKNEERADFGFPLARSAQAHMLTRRGRPIGESSGKGFKPPYPTVSRLTYLGTRSKYFPNECQKSGHR
jgi:hypothetical protein